MKSSALAAAIAPFLAEHASTDGSPEAAARALVAGDSAATVARVAAFLAALDERLAASESTPIEDLVDLAAVECYWERDAGGRYTRYLPAAYGDWVVSTVLPIVLVAEAIRRIGAARASIISFLGPVLTIWLAWWILGETLAGTRLAGTALVLAGVALASKSAKGAES